MKLETSRLILKPITGEDIQHIHNLHSVKEVAEFNTLGVPLDLSVTEKLLQNVIPKNNQEFGWTISLKESNQFIGELGLGISPEMDRGEIHYALLPEVWGNGFASEAVGRIIHFGFDVLYLQSIEANTATPNIRSIKVLEEVGMTKESIQRKTLLIEDDWLDNYKFSMASPFIGRASPSDPPLT